jgi:hypothetical protein
MVVVVAVADVNTFFLCCSPGPSLQLLLDFAGLIDCFIEGRDRGFIVFEFCEVFGPSLISFFRILIIHSPHTIVAHMFAPQFWNPAFVFAYFGKVMQRTRKISLDCLTHSPKGGAVTTAEIRVTLAPGKPLTESAKTTLDFAFKPHVTIKVGK